MRLLRNLTLLYTGVLVAALAASLTAIWAYLRSISDLLGEIRQGLLVVRDETAPLEGLLQTVNGTLPGAAGNLQRVATHLGNVDAALPGTGPRPGSNGGQPPRAENQNPRTEGS